MPETGEQAIVGLTEEQVDEIRRGFERSYLRRASRDWLESPEGRAEVRREIVDKYELCRAHVVPWVSRVASPEGTIMVEIGCGTGAKSAAFAERVGHVYACDLSEDHLEAGRVRTAAMDLDNVSLYAEDADSFLQRMRDAQPEGVDICLMFAVLEHMTLDERLRAMREAWDLLRPGGVLVVVETPNRLLPWDWHSSRLPFFNMLPDDLALRYLDRSPRADYVDAIRPALALSEAEGRVALARQGRGVSYHEFELAFGDLRNVVAADSYDIEILGMNPLSLDELDLKAFIAREGIPVPAGFTRYWIDVVLRKPSGEPRALLADPAPLAFDGFGRSMPVPVGAREIVFELTSDAAHVELAVRADDDRETVIRPSQGRHYHRAPLGPSSKAVRISTPHDANGNAVDAHVGYVHVR